MFSNNSHSNPNGLSPKRKRSHAGLNHLRSQHHPCRCCDPRWSCTGGAERTDSGSASTSHPILLRSQRAVSQGPLARVQQADPHNTIHTHKQFLHTNPSSSSSSCCCSSSSAFPPWHRSGCDWAKRDAHTKQSRLTLPSVYFTPLLLTKTTKSIFVNWNKAKINKKYKYMVNFLEKNKNKLARNFRYGIRIRNGNWLKYVEVGLC